jgi:hypothetical protein
MANLLKGGIMARKKAEKKKTAAPGTASVELASGKSELSGDSVSKRERIELLAYSYWVQRGRQGGSPEEDWLRAEREIDSGISD